MQHQLKACGDVKTSSRAQQNHRRSTAASAKRSVGTGNSFLSTDVTNLEMNSNFMTRKLKKNGNGVIGSPLSNGYFGAQLTANSFNYTPQANPYSNLDFQMAMGSGDVPSLMGMPVHKPSMMLQSDPSMDLTQFTEELQAIQNMPFQPISSSQAALQAFLAANEAASIGSYGFSKSQMLPSNSMRVSGARKNRIVEVKNQNDRLFLVLSDPQASVSTRPTLLPLTRPLQSVAQSCLDLTKKQPLSTEPLYSRKVFIGGLPIDVPDEEVYVTFGSFGKVLIDWPRRPEHNGRASDMYESEMGRRNLRSVSGYVFLVFTHENSVQDLVNACEFYDGKYYLQLSSPTMQDKAVQVRPWRLSDIDFFSEEKVTVDPRRTVFIGGVPRPTRACDLARSLQDYYGKVSYVGIDIDPELKYPKGAARVTFATAQSFVRAISGRFVQVTHAETNKRVEIKPYVMEDQYCDECEGDLCKHNYAPYYCGDSSCLQYYCEGCWDRMHYEMGQSRADHRPMVRTGDQTRILPRPPHHPAAHHSHQRPQYLLHQDQLDNHHSSRVNTSVISRMVNRNSATMLDHVPGKPFSAISTSYGGY